MDRAIRDARRALSRGGLLTAIEITPPGVSSFTINGLATRHHSAYDNDGYPVNSTNAHILLDENAINELGITTRNGNGEVDLSNWLAAWNDATGVKRVYKIIQTRPSETLGLIICIIARYGNN